MGMEWGKSGEMGGGGGYVNTNVMTDEQVHLLQKQISIYTALSEQLVDMHLDDTAASLGEPTMVCGGHKFPAARPRWTPTPMQLEILEGILGQGHGKPSRQRIQDITAELSQHGHISVTNVYNWFQNRRARRRRKQQASHSQADHADAPLIYLQVPEMHAFDPEDEQIDAIMYECHHSSSSTQTLG